MVPLSKVCRPLVPSCYLQFAVNRIYNIQIVAHISGSHDGKVFEERDVEFDYGEGSAIGIVEGLEIALEKMNIGEKSKYVNPSLSW